MTTGKPLFSRQRRDPRYRLTWPSFEAVADSYSLGRPPQTVAQYQANLYPIAFRRPRAIKRHAAHQAAQRKRRPHDPECNDRDDATTQDKALRMNEKTAKHGGQRCEQQDSKRMANESPDVGTELRNKS
jgi:hypothetical protein